MILLLQTVKIALSGQRNLTKCHIAGGFLTRTMLASAGIIAAVVCLSVCLSVTRRCSTERAKRSITQRTPHGSTGTADFRCRKSHKNSNWITPYGGAKCSCGRLNVAEIAEN